MGSRFQEILPETNPQTFPSETTISRRMKLFLEEPFDPQLRTHKLSGKLKGTWGFSINDDYRVLFEFLDKDKVMLIDFGTHDEVY